jgi:SAM-dependent methyltransferase
VSEFDQRLFDLTERAQAHHAWYHGFRAYVRPIVAELAAGRTGLHIIDCGCGTGHNLELLRPYGAAVGFDLSAAALRYARARGVPVARADAVQTPFAGAVADIVTSFDVMQCTPDDGGVVREMARIAKPGGAVVITMAAFDALRGDHSEVWQEYRRYTPAVARALAEQAGLRVERLRFMFGTLLPFMLAARLGQRVARRFRGVRNDTDITVPAAPINALLTWLVEGEAAVAQRLPKPVGSSLLLVARKP